MKNFQETKINFLCRSATKGAEGRIKLRRRLSFKQMNFDTGVNCLNKFDLLVDP